MKKITHSTVRLAGVEDTIELVELTHAINEESNYGLEYNKENAFKYLYNSIWYDGFAIVVAEKDDEIVGYVTVGTSLEYHDKPFCYIGKFFVFLSILLLSKSIENLADKFDSRFIKSKAS